MSAAMLVVNKVSSTEETLEKGFIIGRAILTAMLHPITNGRYASKGQK